MSASDRVSDTVQRPANFVWRRAAIGLVVLVLVLFGVGFFWRWLGGPTTYGPLRKVNDALDASDPGWRLEEIEAAREELPEESNSARVILGAVGKMRGGWPTQEFEDTFRPFEQAANIRLDPERAALLHTEMARQAAALAEARRLAEMPRGRHHLRLGTNLLELRLNEQQQSRRAATLLRYDALDQAHRGNIAAAVESCRACLNAARSLGDEPFLISQMIRIACVAVACDMVERTLAQGEAREADLAALQKLLVEEEKHPTLLVGLRGERAGMNDLFTKLGDGTMTMEMLVGPGGLNVADLDLTTRLFGFTRSNIHREHVRSLELMNRMVDAARLPAHEQSLAIQAVETDLRAQVPTAPLMRLLFPAVQNVARTSQRKTALVRSLMVLVAVERYRLKRGKWPDTLEDLKPDFLKAIPLDPFDGKPIRYLKRGDGVTVYSVGHDGVDNGGTIDRSKTTESGIDLGYRLWDVKARRQTPGAE
jgi:hypothetical protein